jgi:restriction endonuclease Mrr
MNFAKLQNQTVRSALFAGKNLGQVESAIDELKSKEKIYQAEVLAKAESYRKECEEQTAEINRRRQEDIERLRVSSELERLKQEAHADAEKYEEENFPVLALRPRYWQTGTAAQKGIRLEKKFSKLLTDAGFSVSTTAISGDDGIDIIAERRGERIVIQCKNHASKVGSPEVRDFMGALSIEQKKHPGTNGWIVSVSGFSQPTLEKYDSLGLVELWDFSDIHDLVVETYKNHDLKKVDRASGELELG